MAEVKHQSGQTLFERKKELKQKMLLEAVRTPDHILDRETWKRRLLEMQGDDVLFDPQNGDGGASDEDNFISAILDAHIHRRYSARRRLGDSCAYAVTTINQEGITRGIEVNSIRAPTTRTRIAINRTPTREIEINRNHLRKSMPLCPRLDESWSEEQQVNDLLPVGAVDPVEITSKLLLLQNIMTEEEARETAEQIFEQPVVNETREAQRPVVHRTEQTILGEHNPVKKRTNFWVDRYPGPHQQEGFLPTTDSSILASDLDYYLRSRGELKQKELVPNFKKIAFPNPALDHLEENITTNETDHSILSGIKDPLPAPDIDLLPNL